MLPLLELTLTALWERRQDGSMIHRAYNEIGGVTGALPRIADHAYLSLNEQQRTLARRIHLDFVRLGNDHEGVPDLKRRQPVSALIRAMDEENSVQDVLRSLSEARLLVTFQGDEAKHEPQVELVHDVLLRD